ncbi:hypothetical protein [uncultured Lactococcus sp.]|uniref:hypothetical protein n=1 Tax=uncultured Lactococcus sp. TaxID=167973 RepID=UPI0027DAC48E|nr:hypothetical protein [uncultured Lactococcus sp.]
MNPEISELLEMIELLDTVLKEIKEEKIRVPALNKLKLGYVLFVYKLRVKEISATLNPQIPEPYASMSREEILERIGQYDKNKTTTST